MALVKEEYSGAEAAHFSSEQLTQQSESASTGSDWLLWGLMACAQPVQECTQKEVGEPDDGLCSSP